MDRRLFLTASVVLASPLAGAESPEHVPFSQAAFEQALASGEPLLLDFFAPW